MESAATTLILLKQGEIQRVRSHPSFNGAPIPDPSDLTLRLLAIQREIKEQLQRQLTIRMYESEREGERSALAPAGGNRKMPRTAVILNVLIASPSDVSDERDMVTDAINGWNAAHFRGTGIMLHAIRWETHSYPASGDRPQAIINRQLADEGDILIGIFGHRMGTPTGEAQSGTIEEIERFRKAGKHVALYFSTADVPRNADLDQLKALEEYRRERQKDTLYFTFRTADELRQLVSHHLPSFVSEVAGKAKEPLEQTGPVLKRYEQALQSANVRDATLEAVLVQYARQRAAADQFRKLSRKSPSEETQGLSDEILRILTEDVYPVRVDERLPGRPLIIRVARNVFRVLFAAPMRVPPRLQFNGLPEGNTPEVREVSRFGFTVVFYPENVEIETFGFTADAEL